MSERKPKKTNDHSALSTSWIRKMTRAALTGLLSTPFRQTSHAAMAIRIYSIVHIGANNQLGGENTGFCRAAYHIGIAGVVNREPNHPADKQIIILTKSLITFINLTDTYPALPASREMTLQWNTNQTAVLCQ